MSDFVLYNYFRSSTSYRARIALELKGIRYEYKPVHLVNNGGEQHTAEYQSLNPASEVPTLKHGQFVLAQSMAILEYLDEVQPEPKLFPQDLQLKNRVRQFCENINCTHSLQNLKVIGYLEKNLQADATAKQEWLNRWLGAVLDVSEKLVKKHGGRFCFGDQPTAADAFLIPQLFSSRRFQVPVESYVKLLAIEKECLSLKAFQKAHPHNQIDTPENLKGQF